MRTQLNVIHPKIVTTQKIRRSFIGWLRKNQTDDNDCKVRL